MEHPQLWTSAWWQDSLALQAYVEASVDPDDAKKLCADVAEKENKPWSNLFETSSDDQLWWSLTWISCDPTNTRYITRSKALHAHVLQTWNASYCGGGVLWDSELTYKNAITNALLIHSSCELYKVTDEEKYLDNAIETWEWFSSSGMINSDNLVVDGLTEDCVPTGAPFTYNSGILLQSLTSLYEITSNKDYLSNATNIAIAALKRFQATDAPGILADDCCVSFDNCTCNHDGISFHGILARSLAAFVRAGGDVDGSVASALTYNAETAWGNRDVDTNQMGIAWEGPVDKNIDPNDACVAQTAGLQLLTAAGM
ncbi:hypothetical protein TrLO_g15791 [Triparma laevis f. longispina]|uniref:Mannan endo-1,6-alpha-mannosidase n=1 Tax=Triparma laevis f. longispina TaxID=1714387 RepID=A0A9W7FF07_9STRA|nr:hypothetical protein TrLO_g15791 [Triparma laevis f. longispina]